MNTPATTSSAPPPAPAQPAPATLVATMGLVGLLAGVLIVATHYATLPIITRKMAEVRDRAIFAVMPGAVHKKPYGIGADGQLQSLAEDSAASPEIFACYDATNHLVGVALMAQGQGFQDTVRVIYGYDPQRQAIVGMKVLDSKETPGLGDRIEKDPGFRANFADLDVSLAADGRSLAHPITLVKPGAKTHRWEIDGASGATISSKAVATMLRLSAEENIPRIRDHLSRLQENP